MYVFLPTTMGNLPPMDHHISTKCIITRIHGYPFTSISYLPVTHIKTHESPFTHLFTYTVTHIKTHEYPFTHQFTYAGSLQLPTSTSSTRKYPWSLDYPCSFINRFSSITHHIIKYHRTPNNHHLLHCSSKPTNIHLPICLHMLCVHICWIPSFTHTNHRIPANHHLPLHTYNNIRHLPAMEGMCMHLTGILLSRFYEK